MWPLMLCLYNTESIGTEWTMTEKTIRNKTLLWYVSRPMTAALWVQGSLDMALYEHRGAASLSQALVLMGLFNQTSICWRDNTAGHKQPRRFLEHIDKNFLSMTWEPMLSVLSNKECLVGNVKLKGKTGLLWPWNGGIQGPWSSEEAHSKVIILDFRRPDFWDQLDRVPWHKALERKGAHEGWLILKGYLFQA